MQQDHLQEKEILTSKIDQLVKLSAKQVKDLEVVVNKNKELDQKAME